MGIEWDIPDYDLVGIKSYLGIAYINPSNLKLTQYKYNYKYINKIQLQHTITNTFTKYNYKYNYNRQSKIQLKNIKNKKK